MSSTLRFGGTDVLDSTLVCCGCASLPVGRICVLASDFFHLTSAAMDVDDFESTSWRLVVLVAV